MTMTNLGKTKEEIIYELTLRICSNEIVWRTSEFDFVNKATKIYKELVRQDIIIEEDPNEELRKGLNRVRRQAIMDKAYDMSVDGFNELMAYLEPVPTEEKVEMYNMAGDIINTINMRKSNTFPTEEVNM